MMELRCVTEVVKSSHIQIPDTVKIDNQLFAAYLLHLESADTVLECFRSS